MLNISETFSKAIYTNDAYDMVAIASIPLVGIAWSLFRQIKAKEQSNRCTTKNELFHMIQLKNRIKKLSAIGGLVQIAAVLGASILIGSLNAAQRVAAGGHGTPGSKSESSPNHR